MCLQDPVSCARGWCYCHHMIHIYRRWQVCATSLWLMLTCACAPPRVAVPRRPEPELPVLLRVRPQPGQKYALEMLEEQQVAGQGSDRIIARAEVRILAVAPDGRLTREVRFTSVTKFGMVFTKGLPAYREEVSPRGRTLSHVELEGSGHELIAPKQPEVEMEYPEAPIAPGGEWTQVLTRTLAGTQKTATNRIRGRLERIERRPGGHAIAHLRFEGEGGMDAPVETEPTLRTTMTSTSETRVTVDLTDGMLVDSKELNTVRIREEDVEQKVARTSVQWHGQRVARRDALDDLPPFELLSRGLAPPLAPACRARIERFRGAVAASQSGWVMGEGEERTVLEMRHGPASWGDPIEDASKLPKLVVPLGAATVEFLGRRMSPDELRVAMYRWLADVLRPGEPPPELYLYVDRRVPQRTLGRLIAPVRQEAMLYVMEENIVRLAPGQPPPAIAERVATAKYRWSLGRELFHATVDLCEPAARAADVFDLDDLYKPAAFVAAADQVLAGMAQCGCEFGDLDVLEYVMTHLWSLRAQHAKPLSAERNLDRPEDMLVDDLYFE